MVVTLAAEAVVKSRVAAPAGSRADLDKWRAEVPGFRAFCFLVRIPTL